MLTALREEAHVQLTGRAGSMNMAVLLLRPPSPAFLPAGGACRNAVRTKMNVAA